MKLSEIHIFPVKGCAALALPSALVEPWGLAHDRRWMAIDETGRFITQRAHPVIALISATPVGSGLRLDCAGHPTLEVAVPEDGAASAHVTVWRNSLDAPLADRAANDWISTVLGQPCRLVYMRETASRPVNPAYGQPGETVSFADAYPVLLISLDSLADLNARLAHPVPVGRFRANLVAQGAGAWAEDRWRRLRIGSAVFRVAKPCDRCIVTTIDQATGLRPDRLEPLRTLGLFRHDERGIMFGQNLVPETPGEVATGDRVEVLESGLPNVQPVLPVAE